MFEYGIATDTFTGSGSRSGGSSTNLSYWVGYFEQNPEILIASIVGILLIARYILAR